jgi:CrcB protein
MPRFDRRELAAIVAGGFAGGDRPRGAGRGVRARARPLAVGDVHRNVLGAFLLGWLATRLQERLPLSRYRRPLLGTGLCGALTTFSTVQVELLRMIDAAEWALALGYAGASLGAGFAAVLVATNLVRRARLAA